jgi:hypothetical protein
MCTSELSNLDTANRRRLKSQRHKLLADARASLRATGLRDSGILYEKLEMPGSQRYQPKAEKPGDQLDSELIAQQ